MFDLFRSREKSVRILLGGLLFLVALSMLTYLVPSYNTGSSANDYVVAEVGKDVITQMDVQRLIQNTMRGRQLPPEILPNYIPNMVEQMVNDRAMAYQAARLGYEVTDDDVRNAIRQLIPNLFPDGKFVGKEMYAAMLGQQNLTIPEFENDLKRQILITRLRDVVMEGSIVTPVEIEAAYRKKNEKIKIEHVKLTSDKYRSEAQPSVPDMQTYFKANAAQFQVPEKRNLAVLIADQSRLEQTLNPSEADLQRVYNQNQEQFRVPEQVKVRHILLKTEGKPASDDAKIKAQAEDLLKQVRAGANFADLVKKYSEDTGSVSNGGEYTVNRGQMVPEFEKASFSLKPGETDLVKTQYGYHIVQVLQHDQARLKPFAEAKTDLAAQWKKQRVSEKMQQISDQAQSMLQKDPQHPEKIAAELNMQLVRADGLEPGKQVPEVGASPDFDQSIAALKKGEVSQPVALAGNKIALAVVTDVIPARPSTFEEVQDKVRDNMVQSRLQAILQNHAKELADKAKSMGGDLAKAAKSMGLEAKTSAEFGRADNVEGLSMASYFQEGFSRPDGTVFGPVPLPDATVVAKVVAHVQPDMSKLPEQRDAIRDQIKSDKARDRNALFEAGVRESLIKQGRVKIHQDVINRLIAGYKAG